MSLSNDSECPRCEGRGWIKVYGHFGPDPLDPPRTGCPNCPNCGGTGVAMSRKGEQ